MLKIIKKINLDFCAVALVVFFVIIFSGLSFGRHDALKSYLNDLGTYDQVIWNTVHGNFFDNSSNMLDQRNYLGAHFSPILLFFVPFYAVFATPKWLLFFQAAAAGASGLFIYFFAKEKLKKNFLAIIFLLAFLLNPFLQNGILYDFHEVVLAVFFASGAFYFLEKEKWKTFLSFSFLLVISQEHLALLVFMLGIYLMFIKKKRWLGFWVSACSGAYFVGVILIAMPFFSSTGVAALVSGSMLYPSRYSWLGGNFFEIAKNIFIYPDKIAGVLFVGDRVRYMVFLITPVLSLAIYSWPIVLILPLLLINLLSSYSMTYSVYFYYSAIFIPFVFFSAIITFKRFFSGDVFLERMFAIFILIFSFGVFYLSSVSPLGRNSYWEDFVPSGHAEKIVEIEKIVPADASISVQHNLGPHFSERREIYRFPLKKDTADWIILDRFDPYTGSSSRIFDFDYALQMDFGTWKNDIETLENDPAFKKIFDDGEYLVFKRIKKI